MCLNHLNRQRLLLALTQIRVQFHKNFKKKVQKNTTVKQTAQIERLISINTFKKSKRSIKKAINK